MQPSADLVDLGIIVLIVLSALIGLIRGFVREAVSLATWIAAAAFAFLYVRPLAAQLPFAVQSEVVRLGIAFAIIFFGVLVAGAIINYLFNAAISAIGLGGVDRFFGGLFGAFRGALLVTLSVVLLGLTSLPANAWWRDSRLLPSFELAAVKLKNYIPADVSNFLEKGAANHLPAQQPAPTEPAQ
ncbi:CvpA family protein [uncultured Thiothrix sp.]|uniref:CvpA family protein n=1 Tax=uncultured Thiothrix sp. TaxID=223185 RepID=UPI0026176901|nr:CvpA family protein [uncultured Thiothrix sp.]